MTVDCDGLRLGGSISGSTLTGGLVIGGEDYGITLWNGLMGYPGRRGGNVAVINTDGARRVTGKPYRERLMVLNIVAWDRNSSGGYDNYDRCEQLEDNIDTLLQTLDGGVAETCIVQRDMHDGFTRWIEGEVIDAFNLDQASLFSGTDAGYQASIILRCWHPLWQSETLNALVVAGTDSITVGGNAPVRNMQLVYAADGTLTYPGGVLEIDGAAGAATVEVGTGVVTVGGSPAPGLVIPSEVPWMTLYPGTYNLTASGSVTVNWRNQWL